MKSCVNCVNCDLVRGFMVTCHYSYDEQREDGMYHVQVGQDVHKNQANKCGHYSEEKRDRDAFFVL